MDQRRKSPRVFIQSEIWIGQDGIFTRNPERMRDLSEGGAFIECGQRFSTGSILNLRFTLPDANLPISCTVVVRNLRGGSGLGVEFLDLSREDRHRIRRFVGERVSDELRGGSY